MARGVTPAIYTQELFSTNHGEANCAAVAAVPADDLDLVGLAFRAERKTVERSSTRCASIRQFKRRRGAPRADCPCRRRGGRDHVARRVLRRRLEVRPVLGTVRYADLPDDAPGSNGAQEVDGRRRRRSKLGPIFC